MDQTAVFTIAPSVVRTGLLTAVTAVVFVLAVGAMGFAWYTIQAAKNATFTVCAEGLRIEGGPYGRTIPYYELDTTGARAVDLGRDSGYAPKWRTNGAALPGLRNGWFRLQNGHKALLFVTDPQTVVLVPTKNGYDVLLSIPEPEAFLKALRSIPG